MNLLDFSYITEIPLDITEQMAYELGALAFNLALTITWIYLLTWIVDKLFCVFDKFYRK